jgi:hypothetical protein
MSLLTVYNFDNKRRYGANKDGGYVIAELDGGYDCYVSAGVNDEESFTRDFLNDYNIDKKDCYAFDGTINDYPYEYTTNINFIKKNIGSENTDTTTNFSFLTEKYKDIFLKMDIEGSEVAWVNSMRLNDLQKFKQIVIEFHDILEDTRGSTSGEKLNSFGKLYQTHYIVHAHGNNNGGIYENGFLDKGGLKRVQYLPQVVELTYVRKDCFIKPPGLNTKSLPDSTLDFPNIPHLDDINLNYDPFVFNLG